MSSPTEKTEGLKACPFCGRAPVLVADKKQVLCSSISRLPGECHCTAVMLDIWQHRPIETKLQSSIVELEELNAQLIEANQLLANNNSIIREEIERLKKEIVENQFPTQTIVRLREEIERLNKKYFLTLNFCAGYMSGSDRFKTSHPQDAKEWIIEEVEKLK